MLEGGRLVMRPPFREPHHSASQAALTGGGQRARPGEISLAHRGVLFMDELPEFDHRVLEALREPLEAGTVTLARANDRLKLPAEFQLVAAMNPCPCGFLGDPANPCRCGPRRVRRYRERLSGPLLDRIDLHLEVPRVELAALRQRSPPIEGSAAAIRDAVQAARSRQMERQSCSNARLDDAGIEAHCRLEPGTADLLERLGDRLRLSARGYHRLLKVARTIADLEGAGTIGAAHVAEAASLRPPATDGALTGPSGPGNPRPA
jgi:magnesium chelatase family protein